MSALAVIPATLPNTADIGDLVRSTAIRALEALDDAETPEEVNSLRKQWEAFVLLADVKRRRSTAQAAAVSRMMEVRLGEMLSPPAGVEVQRTINAPRQGSNWRTPKVEGITKNEIWLFRSMWEHREVVEDVIAHATNSAPATRNRVVEAIRWHRMNTGDIKRTAPIKNKPKIPRHVRDRVSRFDKNVSDGFTSSQVMDGDLSVVYQRIRQAQATLDRCPKSLKVEMLAVALVQAEALAVEAIRHARCEP